MVRPPCRALLLAPLVCLALTRCDCAPPLPPDLRFRCDTSADCAAGATCLGGVCRREGEVSLAFASAPQTVRVDACSGPAVVELREAAGQPVVLAAPLDIGLGAIPAGGLGFFADPSCATPVTRIAIAAGQSRATFHFRGSATGTVQVTAQAAQLSPAQQTETLTLTS